MEHLEFIEEFEKLGISIRSTNSGNGDEPTCNNSELKDKIE